MASQTRTRGTIMMFIGILMVLTAVAIAFATEEPLPAAFGVIGVVFVAVGSQQRRHG
ncbi:MAG: hypothetical protein PVJ28_02490 [Acidimicrobiia bacterium]|jgi:hypothetical protein